MTKKTEDQPTPDKDVQAGRPNSGSTNGLAESEPILTPMLTIEDRLVLAQANRTHTENERQNIANEILMATKEVCQNLISEGESTLAKARSLETKAEQNHLEALSELEQAQSTREEAVIYAAKVIAEADQEAEIAEDRAGAQRDEADNYAETIKVQAKQQAEKLEEEAAMVKKAADAHAERVKSEAQQQAEKTENLVAPVKKAAEAYAEAVISQAKQGAERVEQQAAIAREEADAYSEAVRTEAQQQAEEIIELARAAAEQEAASIRQQSQDEAGEALAQVEMVRLAVQQELEAQQVYTESARVTVESLEVLGQIRAKLVQYPLYPEGEQISESAGDDQPLVEHPGDCHPGDCDPEDSPRANLSDDQLKAWLE